MYVVMICTYRRDVSWDIQYFQGYGSLFKWVTLEENNKSLPCFNRQKSAYRKLLNKGKKTAK